MGHIIRRINNSDHTTRAMRLGSKSGAVEPDRLVVLHCDGEGSIGRPRSSNWNEATEDAPSSCSRATWPIKVGLNDRVVLGEELEGDIVPNFGNDSVWCEGESVSADSYIVHQLRSTTCDWVRDSSVVSGRVIMGEGHRNGCNSSDEGSRDHIRNNL